jgi:multidrug efflux pump
MLCSRILKPVDDVTPTKFAIIAEKSVNWIITKYTDTLRVVLNHQKLVLIIAMSTFILTFTLAYFIPKGFFPVQDTGMIQGISEAEDNISFAHMADKQQELANIVLEDKDVENLSSFIGIDNSNATINKGRMLINLKEKRSDNVQQIIVRLNQKLKNVVGSRLYLQPVEDLNVADQVSNAPYVYMVIGQNLAEVSYWSELLINKLKENPILTTVGRDLHNKGLQVFIDINRDKAATLGINVQMIDDAIYNMFGQRQISTIFTQRNQYKVVLEGLPNLQKDLDALNNVYVTSASGASVPLKAFAKISQDFTSLAINRYNQFSAMTVYFDFIKGSSLGAAIDAVSRAKEELNIPLINENILQAA